MMDKDEYIVIAGKVADGIASESELALYNAYYNEYQVKYPVWNSLDEVEKKKMLDETAALVQALLKPETVVRKIKLWPRVMVAAAAVTAITLGIWLYNVSLPGQSSSTPEFVSGSKEIGPGKNLATLAFDDGKVITLKDVKKGVLIGNDKATYDDGSSLQAEDATWSSHKVQMLTAATPRGGSYHITLPDGTGVWLNAASSLKFPSTFSKQSERKVELIGEAFFEVFKNKAQPFIVRSQNQDVKVLGTVFNIESYPGEALCKTTLVEGSVQVSRNSSGAVEQMLILKPGQQSRLNSSTASVEAVDVNAAIAWTKGDFVFSQEELSSIMKKIGRWYDVEVVYQDAPVQLRFEAIISRSKNLSQILQTMQTTGKVKFKIDGRKVIVTK